VFGSRAAKQNGADLPKKVTPFEKHSTRPSLSSAAAVLATDTASAQQILDRREAHVVPLSQGVLRRASHEGVDEGSDLLLGKPVHQPPTRSDVRRRCHLSGRFNRIGSCMTFSAFPQVGGQSGIQPEAGHPDGM
jgi:hypothetical protein